METENKTESKMMETYADDMATVIENDTEGLVRKIIHGEEERQAEKKNLSPESKKNRLFMVIGISFIVIALSILSFFIFFRKNINTVPVEQQFVPIVFNDKSTFIEIAGFIKEKIAQIVLNQVNATSVKKGGLEGIYLTENKQIIGLRRFVDLTKSSFVPNSDNLLVSDNFLMGVVNNDEMDSTGNNRLGFFILLKTSSTADIFDSLRAWEKNLLIDLHGFIGISINKDTNYLFTKDFQDGIIENKNARILYDKDGGVVMMYVFTDNNSVVITDSQNTVHEIMLRLASSKKTQ